jgi:Zn-dependent M28 family amino/carboxypeptidase
MKKTSIIITCIFLLSGYNFLYGQYRTTSALVEILSSDDFEGRRPGTDGMERATRFIEQYLEELEVPPFFQYSYRDTLDVYGAESYNLVGIIHSADHTDEHILIGAHIDHLGMLPDGSVYNGANDNASGVTAVLQIAEALKRHEITKNVIIAIFTGEESGLLGSRHLAKRLKAIDINPSYMINFEMIGVPLKSGADKVYITGHEISNFAEVSNDLLDEEFIVYEQVESDFGLFRMSDNYPFFIEFGIPSHTVSTFDFQNYEYLHHIMDEYSKLDTEHMESIINKSADLILKLIKTNAQIELAKQEVTP